MPKGLKPIKRRLATGEVRLYWYHRASGKRLQNDPESAEGLLEVVGLDQAAKGVEALTAHPRGSLAALWTAYHDSPEWARLRTRTRRDYEAVRDWIGPAAERAIVATITAKMVKGLRDKAAKAKGRRFGNYVLQVVRLVLEWGKGEEWIKTNPAMGLKTIRKPTDARKVNRAWALDEIEAFVAAAPPQLLVPFALGLFAGMRQGDALRVTWRAYDGAGLRWTASKNGEDCTAPVSGPFKALLDAAKARKLLAVQIALTSKGAAWSESGFRASFFKLLRQLRADGLVRPGCTFQGLRHTIATAARDGSESEFRVAAAIGDRSTAMASVYGRDADRQEAQNAVLGAVQKRFGNIDWKTPTP